MNVGLHRWKRYLALGAMALVLPLLMAACGGDDNITVKIWDGEAGLGSQSVASDVFEFIIENGQVRVVVDERARIYNAVAAGEELTTKTRVRVTAVNNDNTLTVTRI